jgi:prepilin-type N-terminal cleavage/methylation domain-containing protein
MTPSSLLSIRGTRKGFTLVEVMLVLATIGLLAVIGVPSYLRARKRSQTGVLMNELRATADAFQIFASETRNLPPSSTDLSAVPAGMEAYLPSLSTWTTALPGGGYWYWVSVTPPAEIWGFTGLIGIYNPAFTSEQIDQIDSTMDDGNPSTGGIRSFGDWVFLGVK